MDFFVPISMLNDFVFCPYSIYLHQVYMELDEGMYHARDQVRGRIAHETVDRQGAGHKRNELRGLSVFCESLGVGGKIDTYKPDEKMLVERKYRLTRIFRGQLYQLWAEYYSLLEMGFEIEQIAFYETSTNKMYCQPLPQRSEFEELKAFADEIRAWSPASELQVNPNKCRYCIYSALCDRKEDE